MTESTFPEKVPALPAWRVIWEMLRFRPWLWFIDLLCVALFRSCWQLAPALIIKAFFDMLTGAAPLTFGIWAIVAFALSTWVGRVIASYGFYYADVPIFADIPTLLRKNLLRHILRRPGAAPLPDSPGEAISRFRGDTFEIPLFALWLNDLMGSIAFNIISLYVMFRISTTYTLLAMLPLIVAGGIAAARHVGTAISQRNLLTFDMGGTSCDVGLIVDGSPRYTTRFDVEWGLPIVNPTVDVRTVGAGGGSIGWVDRGGFLRVGPRSAGAEPVLNALEGDREIGPAGRGIRARQNQAGC